MQLNIGNKRLVKGTGTASQNFITLGDFLEMVEDLDHSTPIVTYNEKDFRGAVGIMRLKQEDSEEFEIIIY